MLLHRPRVAVDALGSGRAAQPRLNPCLRPTLVAGQLASVRSPVPSVAARHAARAWHPRPLDFSHAGQAAYLPRFAWVKYPPAQRVSPFRHPSTKPAHLRHPPRVPERHTVARQTKLPRCTLPRAPSRHTDFGPDQRATHHRNVVPCTNLYCTPPAQPSRAIPRFPTVHRAAPPSAISLPGRPHPPAAHVATRRILRAPPAPVFGTPTPKNLYWMLATVAKPPSSPMPPHLRAPFRLPMTFTARLRRDPRLRK